MEQSRQVALTAQEQRTQLEEQNRSLRAELARAEERRAAARRRSQKGRAILLHGPPGNGKTSAIRAMMSEAFRRLARPHVMTMEYRLPEIEHEAREHGVTLEAVAERKTDVPALKRLPAIMRSQQLRRNLFAEFDRVKDLLLL